MGFASVVFAIVAAYLAGAGTVVLFGGSAITTGSWLLQGLEIMGPLIFFLAAVTTAAVAYGLARQWTWARRAGIILAALFAVNAVPAVSAAVVSQRAGSILLNGTKLMVAVIVIQRLWPRPAISSLRA